MTSEQLAEFFHTTYERLAPEFGYETREASAKPWSEVPTQNKALMIAVAGEVLAELDKTQTSGVTHLGYRGDGVRG